MTAIGMAPGSSHTLAGMKNPTNPGWDGGELCLGAYSAIGGTQEGRVRAVPMLLASPMAPRLPDRTDRPPTNAARTRVQAPSPVLPPHFVHRLVNPIELTKLAWRDRSGTQIDDGVNSLHSVGHHRCSVQGSRSPSGGLIVRCAFGGETYSEAWVTSSWMGRISNFGYSGFHIRW